MTMLIPCAHVDDAAALTALAHAAKSHWDYPPRWIEIWKDDLTFTPAFIQAHPVFVAIEDDTLLGCYALMLEGDKGIVEYFWVHPSAMGLGRMLFGHATVQAAAEKDTASRVTRHPRDGGEDSEYFAAQATP